LVGIAKFMMDGFSVTGFPLDPNEVPSNDAFNELVGGDFRFDSADGGFIDPTSLAAYQAVAEYLLGR
jgi:hypothetical protein